MLVLGGLGVLARSVMWADLMVWYSPGLGDFCGAAIMQVCADGLCLTGVLDGWCFGFWNALCLVFVGCFLLVTVDLALVGCCGRCVVLCGQLVLVVVCEFCGCLARVVCVFAWLEAFLVGLV